MKAQRLSGYIILSLSSIQDCTLDEFIKAPSYVLSDELSYYSSNIRSISKTSLDKAIRKDYLTKGHFSEADKRRFHRLRLMQSAIYKYEVSYSIEPLSKILKFYEKEAERCLIFESNNLVDDYLEVLKMFHLNSFLYQRKSSPRFVDHLFFKTAYISKNKLLRLLSGKGRGVYREVFELIPLILDKDFKNNLDSIHRKIYREG
ncbi:MAG: hypothetical protein H7A25_18095 [Leptospiraceae bacterium]|nr:hypothetical protein [Leptospiraceae bacterium]MCP5501819.1 hypothetical protein [Leptospiraceae bacterium]